MSKRAKGAIVEVGFELIPSVITNTEIRYEGIK